MQFWLATIPALAPSQQLHAINWLISPWLLVQAHRRIRIGWAHPSNQVSTIDPTGSSQEEQSPRELWAGLRQEKGVGDTGNGWLGHIVSELAIVLVSHA